MVFRIYRDLERFIVEDKAVFDLKNIIIQGVIGTFPKNASFSFIFII